MAYKLGKEFEQIYGHRPEAVEPRLSARKVTDMVLKHRRQEHEVQNSELPTTGVIYGENPAMLAHRMRFPEPSTTWASGGKTYEVTEVGEVLNEGKYSVLRRSTDEGLTEYMVVHGEIRTVDLPTVVPAIPNSEWFIMSE